jgi:site-specific DNA recombinase
MVQYYGVKSEQQALEKWKIETGLQKEPVDQYQSHRTLVKEKMEEKAKKGAYLGSAHPYGYDYRNNKLITNPVEAPIVKKIYELYIKGWSLGRIAEYLDKNKVPTKKRGKWDKKKISNILKNPLYCGLVDWNGIVKEGQHKAIIDKTTFLEAQKVLGTRSGKPYSALKLVNSVDVR